MNTLTYAEKKKVDAALQESQSDIACGKNAHFKSVQAIADVYTKTLGFKITRANVDKMIQECEIPYEHLIKEGGGGGSLFKRLKRMDEESKEIVVRIEMLENENEDLHKKIDILASRFKQQQ